MKDNLPLAMRIVREGAKPHRAGLEKSGATAIGKLWTFSPTEAAAVQAVRGTVEGWARRPGPDRPLCLGVFGPPGAGKTFAVNQILASLQEGKRDARPAWAQDLRAFTFNLTQFEHTRELAQALAKVPERLVKGELPVVFFDEFDAPRGARDLGWLPWFLAPMQDGEWMLDGERHTLRKAVYVFAGGTAWSFAGFCAADGAVAEDQARRAKRPDFVSRLRGSLDVSGVDAEPRALRRALVLRQQLEAWNATWLGCPGFVPKVLEEHLARRLLTAESYRDGARSLGAVLDLVRADAPQALVAEEDLAERWEEIAGVGARSG